jgi:hypothetical protein
VSPGPNVFTPQVSNSCHGPFRGIFFFWGKHTTYTPIGIVFSQFLKDSVSMASSGGTKPDHPEENRQQTAVSQILPMQAKASINLNGPVGQTWVEFFRGPKLDEDFLDDRAQPTFGKSGQCFNLI